MKPTDVLSPDEMKYFSTKSNWRGAWELAVTYGLISGSLVLVAFWPNVFSILAAVIVLGNRQLGLAILTHDASHYAIFKNKEVNNFIGKWFCAGPIILDVHKYRDYHFQHHRKTGISFNNKTLTGDPDIILTRNYPCSKKTMLKWAIKDLTGRTSIKASIGLFMMNMGLARYDLSGRFLRQKTAKRTRLGWVWQFFKTNNAFFVWHIALAGTLFSLGYGAVYGVWWLAFFTTYPFYTRIRSVAEHGMLPRVPDMLKNTRTTEANLLERITFAPHHVNYHLEHHFLMSAPSYKLRKLHRLMQERGALENSPVASGYREILSLATR